MSRYDGLIIPRSYSEYINKTDAATLLQALQLSGVMDAAPTAGSNHPVKSSGLIPANEVASGNMQSVTSNAVSKSESYLTDEIIDTGKIFRTYGGSEYKVYRATLRFNLTEYTDASDRRTFGFTYQMPANTIAVIAANGYFILNAPNNANGYGRKYVLGSTVVSTDLNVYITSNCDYVENTGNAYLAFILNKSNFPITNITGYAFLEFIKSS